MHFEGVRFARTLSRLGRLALRQAATSALLLLLCSVRVSVATPNYTIHQLGFSGGVYAHSGSAGTSEFTFPQDLNGAGEAAGYSYRYDSAGNSLGQDTWCYDSVITTKIGLSGPAYGYATGGGIYESSYVEALNGVGEVLGNTGRYSPSGGLIGADTWIYSGGLTSEVGLTMGIYSAIIAGGTAQDSIPRQINDSGDATGISYREDASGNSLGFDAWYFNGSTTQQIGLTGSVYGANGGTYSSSEPTALDAAGEAVGYSDRDNQSLGQDVWFFDGKSTQEIGYTGGAYARSTNQGVYQNSAIVEMNASGEVTGWSANYTALTGGRGAWLYANKTMTAIGLTGVPYANIAGASSSTPVHINATGEVMGYSVRYNQSLGNSTGQDAWIFDGTATREIGLLQTADSRIYSVNTPLQINDSGQVIGTTQRNPYPTYGLDGQDSWIFDGAVSEQIGLVGGVYSIYDNSNHINYESSSPQLLNESGRVAGASTRYPYNYTPPAAGITLGSDAWYFNGKTTSLIGVYGGADSYTSPGEGVYEFNVCSRMNSVGQVIGTANRYDATGNSLGTDGWFYDPSTDTSTLLQFSVDSASGYSNTDPMVLAASGVVLGNYELFSGSTDEGSRAFYWSEAVGFRDLGGLVAGGLTANEWQDLSNFYSAIGNSLGNEAPLFITGVGGVTGETAGQSGFLLSLVSIPEPTTLLPLIVAFAICRRRATL